MSKWLVVVPNEPSIEGVEPRRLSRLEGQYMVRATVSRSRRRV